LSFQFNLLQKHHFDFGDLFAPSLAYVWSSVSAANGHVEAATNRDLFAKRLSPAVLAEAQALAGQYVELYQPKQ
jgi:hypothetical protein